MKKNLTYSIYYNQEEWFSLLTEIERYTETVSLFFLRLSYVRGSHIEFTEVTDESEQIVALDRFSERFNIFLKNNPSKNSNLVSESHSLFSDFPNNSIHYGIHDYLFLDPNSDVPKKIHARISLLIISILKAYKNQYIDFCDQIMMQILLILCNVINQNDNDTLTFMKSLLNSECAKYGKHGIDRVMKISQVDFADNKKDIINYYDEMINKKLVLREEWEMQWYSLINDASLKSVHKPYHVMIETLFENIAYKNKIYLYSLLNQGISSL